MTISSFGALRLLLTLLLCDSYKIKILGFLGTKRQRQRHTSFLRCYLFPVWEVAERGGTPVPYLFLIVFLLFGLVTCIWQMQGRKSSYELGRWLVGVSKY